MCCVRYPHSLTAIEIRAWVNSPFHEICASWRCLEFQPIKGAEALQCGTVCCYLRQAAGDLKEMHWKVVAENEVMDARSAFTRVNLTVGTTQKVVTKVLIRRMLTNPEVIRLYWPCHLFVSPAWNAQYCTRCAVHWVKFQTKCYLLILLHSKQNMDSVSNARLSKIYFLWV